MKGLVHLLLGMTCLCDAGVTLYDSDGFAISGSKESEENIDLPCGMITSPTGDQFRPEMRMATGGTDSKYSEFPWMVALFAIKSNYSRQWALTDSQYWHFRCGGSLISYEVVLTAAVCVHGYKRNELKARAGDWNLDTFDEPHPYQERIVTKLIIHPQFHNSKLGNELRYDVALVIVKSPYTFADNIGFICLPPPDLNTASANCKVAGWGVQTYMESGHQQHLHVVDLNYVSNNQCQRTLRQLWWTQFVLHDSFICAGGVQDKDTCQGDGGSPLMCLGDDHYYARGLTSWGVGCGKDNYPGMYTDVVKVRSWIDNKMIANGFDTDTYTHISYRK